MKRRRRSSRGRRRLEGEQGASLFSCAYCGQENPTLTYGPLISGLLPLIQPIKEEKEEWELDPRPGFCEPMRYEFFSFLYLKKIKISKIYVRFEKIQNYPRSPYGGRQALDVIFFFKFATRSMAEKKMKGRHVAPQQATWSRPPI